MHSEDKNIVLSDLIDIHFLQELQDTFAKTMGVASITIDNTGPITKPSNLTEFCNNHIRRTELGLKRCEECVLEGEKLVEEKGEPVIYTCPMGLTHFAVPIMIEGKHIASILGDQLFLEKPSEERFRELAKELGIKEEEKYIEALRKVNVVPIENIKASTQLLFIVANAISKVAHKNLELIERNKRENLLRKMVEIIRSSVDMDFVKHEIVFQIGAFLKADRVAFADYDFIKENYFISPENEYRSSNKVKTFVGYDFAATPGFIEAIRRVHLTGQNIIFNDLDKYLEENNLHSTGIEEFYREMGFMSSMAININHGELFYGNLVVTFEEKNKIKENDINLLKILANQAGTALYQAELYSKINQQAKREILLKSIAETVRSTLDIDETKKTIVNIIGKTLNADRCYIAEYDVKTNKFLIIKDEYLSSEKLQGYSGLDFNKELPHFAEAIKTGHHLIIKDKEIFLDTDNQDFGPEKKIIEKYKINSAFTFPLYYHDELLGVFSIHYVSEKRLIGDEEINFLNSIANQLATAIHQAKLYEKIQLQAEREKISRNIIEILRSTLDKEIIKHLFVKNIGKYFDANRVFFSEFDSKTNKFLPLNAKSEYLSSPEEKSVVDYDWSKPNIERHLQRLIEKRELLIPNWDEYIKTAYDNEELAYLYKDANVKSSYNFPVTYENTIIGYFCIEFTQNYIELSDEDIGRIRSICTQAGIALYHAELYLKAQEAVKLKDEIIVKVSDGIKEPVNDIIKNSNTLSRQELKKNEQVEYLNDIISSCNQLLELTKTIINVPNL